MGKKYFFNIELHDRTANLLKLILLKAERKIEYEKTANACRLLADFCHVDFPKSCQLRIWRLFLENLHDKYLRLFRVAQKSARLSSRIHISPL